MRLNLVASAAALFVSFYPASAASISQLVVFGDSLSDNGNAYIASAHQFPGDNYGVYSFPANGFTTSFYSDGPNTTPKAAGPQGLWVDQLAARLNLQDPLPYLAGGTNYAVASAQTGTANLQDMGNQLAAFTAFKDSVSSTALYAFWGGANDILNGADPSLAANNIEAYIAALAGKGATNFVWLNEPLLGDTPEGAVQKDALNAGSVAFDTQWATDIAALQAKGINVTGINIEALFSELIANPSAHGFTNVTTPAQTSAQATDAGYLFWDGLHPTTTGHALVADEVAGSLTATPEPSTVSLAFIGIGAAAAFFLTRRCGTMGQL